MFPRTFDLLPVGAMERTVLLLVDHIKNVGRVEKLHENKTYLSRTKDEILEQTEIKSPLVVGNHDIASSLCIDKWNRVLYGNRTRGDGGVVARRV